VNCNLRPNTSDLGSFVGLVGGDCAVGRCDPECFAGVAGGLWPCSVVCAFEGVAGHLSLDYAGIAALSPGRQQAGQDLADPFEQGVGQPVRGKSPPVR
jgi:hypothetical protein